MDGLKEILAAFEARVRSKIIGSVVLAFAITNWKVLFFLIFERVSAAVKFQYFDDNTNFITLFFVPVLLGSVLALTLPWVNFYGMKWTFMADRKQKQFKNNSQHLDILDKMEYETQVQEFKARKQKAIVASAKAEVEAKSIEDPDLRKRVEEDLDDLEEQMPLSESAMSHLSDGLDFKVIDQNLIDFSAMSLDELKDELVRTDESLGILKEEWYQNHDLLESLDADEEMKRAKYSVEINEINNGNKKDDIVNLKIFRARQIEEYSKRREHLVKNNNYIDIQSMTLAEHKSKLHDFLNKKYDL